MKTCLVFPRLICKSQWGGGGFGVPAFSGHPFKKLFSHIMVLQAKDIIYSIAN